jgi:hypothetical protein
MSTVTDTIIKCDLQDFHTGDKTLIPCTIELKNGSIYIRPEGYGDCGTEDGFGCPVIIEYYEGSIRVVVWGDINSEDPTVNVKLDNAHESKRRD